MFDMSGILSGAKVALEKKALEKFGAAVENKMGGTFGMLAGAFAASKASKNAFVDPKNATPRGNVGTDSSGAGTSKQKQYRLWDPTPYSSAIAGSAGSYDPKTKFLFKVKFEFDPNVVKQLAAMGINSHYFSDDLSYIIKSIDLPKYSFEYEEVNMYNYRTKVLTRIKHQELNLSFYDDTGNQALSFLNGYIMMLSPISRHNYGIIDNHLDSFSFGFPTDYQSTNTSSRASLPQNSFQILKSITIGQYYLKRSRTSTASPEGALGNAIMLNTFTFTNPRIISLDLADQAHDASDAQTVSASFDFDAVYMNLTQPGNTALVADLPQGDILHGVTEIPESEKDYSGATPTSKYGIAHNGHLAPSGAIGLFGGKSSNPFVSILAAQGQRAIANAVKNKLAKSLDGIGNKIGGNGIFGGIINGAVNKAVGKVSGSLGAATDKTLNQISGKIQSGVSGISLPKIPFISDNSVASAAISKLGSSVASKINK